MATKKDKKPVKEENAPIENEQSPAVEVATKIEEVIVSKPLAGGEPVVAKKVLKPKQVFEPMQGVFKTVWVEE